MKPKNNLYFVLGLLNSQLFEWRFRLTSTNNHVNSYEVDSLPLCPVNFTTPAKERKQLLGQAKKLYQDYLKSKDWDKNLVFISKLVPLKADGSPDTDHEHSDVVHDLLAFLAEEMIRLNKEKQGITKSFLTWLEKEIIKGSIEDQKNKTKIKGFHEGTVEELIDLLKKNKVIEDPYPSSKWNTMNAEYSTAMTELTPLKTHVEATDKLIDQIVYKLYRLTPEEIEVVEGSIK